MFNFSMISHSQPMPTLVPVQKSWIPFMPDAQMSAVATTQLLLVMCAMECVT